MMNLKKRILYISFLHSFIPIFFLTLSSCSFSIKQVSYEPPPNPERLFDGTPALATQASNKNGGLTIYQKAEKLEEVKEQSIKENSMAPINYQKSSVGNIDMNTTREEAAKILHLHSIDKGLSIYKEGLKIKWGRNETPDYIVVSNPYKGTMDFGRMTGEEKQRNRKIGQAFADVFTTPPEAERFLVFLFKHLEQTKENCINSKRCDFQIEEEQVIFFLPKMVLIVRRGQGLHLEEMMIFNNNNDNSCFNNPFDLLNMRFFCGNPEILSVNLERFFGYYRHKDININLGDSHETVVKKLGINSQQSIIHNNDSLSQHIFNAFTYHYHYTSRNQNNQSAPNDIEGFSKVSVDWKRNNFEEESQNISGYLSSVSIKYSAMPFLFGSAFLKVKIASDGMTVDIEPVPFSSETLRQLKPKSKEDLFSPEYHNSVRLKIIEYYKRIQLEEKNRISSC